MKTVDCADDAAPQSGSRRLWRRGRARQALDGLRVGGKSGLLPEPIERPQDFADARTRGDPEGDDVLSADRRLRLRGFGKAPPGAGEAGVAGADGRLGLRQRQRVGCGAAAEREHQAAQGVGLGGCGRAVKPGQRRGRAEEAVSLGVRQSQALRKPLRVLRNADAERGQSQKGVRRRSVDGFDGDGPFQPTGIGKAEKRRQEFRARP